MSKVTLTDITSGYNLATTYNANNALIEAAFDNTLSRDGTTPNTMSADLDMNSNRIMNLVDGEDNQDPVTVAQLNAASVVANTTTAALTTLADAGGNYTATTVEAAFSELAGTANGEGASIIGVEDSAGNFAGADVEAVLAEIIADYAATTNGNGASKIGVEDSGTNFTATDVEAVLAEIASDYAKLTEATETVTTTNVITAAESGTTFFLNAAGGFTSTLPAPAAGLRYTFIVKTAPTTAYIVTTNSGDNILYGTTLDIVGELVYGSAQDTVNFVASTSVVGDRLEVFSDGTNWYYEAKSGADGGITTSAT